MADTLPQTCKARPDIRAHLRAARADVIAHAVKRPCYVLNGDGTRDAVPSVDAARSLAHARAWGDIGTEFWAVQYAVDAAGREVCTYRERFLCEILT